MNKANEKERETIEIHSYQNVWDYEKRLYNILNMELPGISMTDFLYFALPELLVILIHFILLRLPVVNTLQLVIEFGLIPYIVMSLLRYNKLDGKKFIPFIRDYMTHLFSKSKQYEFFREIPSNIGEQAYNIRWYCSYRHRLKLQRKRRSRH